MKAPYGSKHGGEARPEVVNPSRRWTIPSGGGQSRPEVDNRAMDHRPLSAIVLAAGEGTRMRSSTPKPLHRLCGRPMVLYVLDALAELSVDRVVVVVGRAAT